MNVLVIDGQGGGIGKLLVSGIKSEYPDFFVTAVGANSIATSAMIKAGADVDDTVDEEPVSGRTPLLVAAESNGNPDVPLILLKEKADKNAVNENGENALMIAVLKIKTLILKTDL